MSLKQIIEQIKVQQPLADEDVESGAAETLNARRGRQRQAVEQLKLLRDQYTQELMRSTVFILAVGDQSEEFTKLLSTEYGAFSADPEAFYSDLAGRVNPQLYKGRESSSSMFDTLSSHLEDVALKMQIIGYPQLIFKAQYRRMLNDENDFRGLVREAINDQMGSEIVGIAAVRSVSSKAIEKGHSDKVTPIVLNVEDPNLAVSLLDTLKRLTPNVAMVTVGKAPKGFKDRSVNTLKNVSNENVEFTLNLIKNKIIAR